MARQTEAPRQAWEGGWRGLALERATTARRSVHARHVDCSRSVGQRQDIPLETSRLPNPSDHSKDAPTQRH